ncbi:hypothetical protein ABB37_00969 [Leptomonas pyrrhocoris]|uniref:Uncharacterized protein n=1 Tax=Leptomonas pyrrhocoris TaxID=157538 RepID=A0A0N0E0X2_LEPPY|nr:hypothetical protein ABB37_00969 [Leptomonas pyrrhocoris]KPA86942.1 hypothetical protein ABB37_00969 [Leptomonas pyrrhocoris]|eukprot:XP_015665381.1 hypothetical protein ABB37_00969 [Leptomonas pyrrhocoris]
MMLKTYSINRTSQKQTAPATRREIGLVMEALKDRSREHAAVLQACKTAGRWGAIQGLTAENLLLVNLQHIVMHFTAGKTPSRDPYKAYALVGIEDANDMGRIAQILSSRKADNPASTQLTTMNMHQMICELKQANPALIAHSIKRGALNFLTACAAQNQLKKKCIPLLAKHGDGKATLHNTIRYITEHVPLAKMIGTQKATRLL